MPSAAASPAGGGREPVNVVASCQFLVGQNHRQIPRQSPPEDITARIFWSGINHRHWWPPETHLLDQRFPPTKQQTPPPPPNKSRTKQEAFTRPVGPRAKSQLELGSQVKLGKWLRIFYILCFFYMINKLTEDAMVQHVFFNVFIV